jgi:L-arabinose isomerase
MNRKKKAKIGLLLIGSPRFKELGKGTAHGTYQERKLQEAEYIVHSFEEIGNIVYDGIIFEREDVKKAMDLFYSEKVDCVVAAYLSWAEDFAWIRFLRDMPTVPIFFTSIIRESVEITDTNDEDQFVEFLSAGSLVGVQEASGDMQRFNRPMSRTFIGDMEQVKEELKVFAKAAKVRNELYSSTMGLLASYNEVMWSTYVDPYNIFMKIGPEIRFLSVAQLMDKIDTVTEEELTKVTERMKKQFQFYPNVDLVKFEASVRASIALEKLSEEYHLDLTVLNDIDPVLFQKVGLRPGFCPTREDSELTVVPEGDIGGGLAVYILKLLSGKRANFIEPFYIVKQRNCFTAGHAGPNDYTQCPENTLVARDERFAKTDFKYAGAPFAWYVFPEGEKTMLHMSEKDGRMKMVCTLVEVLPTKHYLASYSHAEFRHKTLKPEELFNRLINIGVTQHYGIVEGNYTKELEQLAALMNFEFYLIS